jgi:hypothetical protein
MLSDYKILGNPITQYIPAKNNTNITRSVTFTNGIGGHIVSLNKGIYKMTLVYSFNKTYQIDGGKNGQASFTLNAYNCFFLTANQYNSHRIGAAAFTNTSVATVVDQINPSSNSLTVYNNMKVDNDNNGYLDTRYGKVDIIFGIAADNTLISISIPYVGELYIEHTTIGII